MALHMPVVWSETQRLHQPGGEVWIGRPSPADEVPERADAIRTALEGAGASIVSALPHDDAALLAVHDAALVDFLRAAWPEWQAAGYPRDHDQPYVVGYIFAHPGLIGPHAPHVATSPAARTGNFAFDTMTAIGEGTWTAARGAVDVALTAADAVLAAAPAAYACTRPPGHHVTRSAYGGSCYLNNAAIATQYLCDRGAERVALIDIDVHHGNGAQAIFWERGDVLTCSVHVDPAAGWFPHFLGLASEVGTGAGQGANLNLPVEPGAGDDRWLEAVTVAVDAVHAWRPEIVVVALGVDAAAADSNSPLVVTDAGFRAAGRLLGAVSRPTVVVQEGGYDLATIGGLVLAALEGIEEGRP